MGRFILNFTPTGMIPTRAMTTHVPVSMEEIVQDVQRACVLGANMVHLHARDPETGKPTHRKEIYGSIIRAIRTSFPDLVIGVSTSGRDWTEFEKRTDVLDLEGDEKPDTASLTLSSLNFNKQVSINHPEMIQALASRMKERGIKPELEVFDSGMINYAHYLAKKKLIEPPFYFNLILGNISCAQADALHLGLLIRELPHGSYWSVGGVGRAQLTMNVMALAAGGGVRVGLEDNIWFDHDRTQLATNEGLLSRIKNIAAHIGCEPFTRSEVRVLLGLNPR